MIASFQPRLRVGSVSFLNARPLVHHLDVVGPPPVQLLLEVPSLLAERMKTGQLDVALLPSVEYFRGAGYRILPGVCIASDGVVDSVKLFSKKPIDKIESLALDINSRTSAALAQVLLKRKYGKLPALSACSPAADLRTIKEDAILLIGDPAMKFKESGEMYTLDLGEEWKRQTGLPFVYALWVARPSVDLGNLGDRLVAARDAGLQNLREISAQAGAETGIEKNICFNYLKNAIKYHLNERELQALSHFHELAAEDGLCPQGVDIVFVNR